MINLKCAEDESICRQVGAELPIDSEEADEENKREGGQGKT